MAPRRSPIGLSWPDVLPILALLLALVVGDAGVAVAGLNTWTGIGPPGAGRALRVDPAAPLTLYVATVGGVFKTTTGGTAWSPASTGLSSLDVRALVLDPSATATLYAGTAGGVFKSTDGGGSWSPVNSGLGSLDVAALVIEQVPPHTLYAGTAGGVFRSTNGGGWTAVNTGLTSLQITRLEAAPAKPGTLYAMVQGAIFKTTNGGDAWAPTADLPSIGFRLGLTVDPTTATTVYAATATLLSIHAVAYAVFKSVDGGQSWTSQSSGQGVLAIDPTAPATVYVAAAPPGLGIGKSLGGGPSASPVNAGLTSLVVSFVTIDPTMPARLYAGTGHGIFTSTTGGASWSPLASLPAPSASIVSTVAIDPTSPATLYAGLGQGDGVMKTTNGGLTWSAARNGLPSDSRGSIREVAVDPIVPTTLFAHVASSDIFFPSGFFRSTDGGGSWVPVDFGIPGIAPTVGAVVIDPATRAVYVGTTHGVLKGTSGGSSWALASAGLPPDPLVDALVLDPTAPATLYVKTTGGVFKSVSSSTSSSARPAWVTGRSRPTSTATAWPTSPCSGPRRGSGSSSGRRRGSGGRSCSAPGGWATSR